MAINGTPNADTLGGTPNDDIINGLGGNDKIDGGAGADQIDGGDGADIIKGGDGDDTITGGSGNDNIVGGAGRDMAVYATAVAAASAGGTPIGTWTGALLTLTTGGEGIDILNQVETLRFNGQDFAVTGYNRDGAYNVVANLGADKQQVDQGSILSGNVLANDYDVDSRLTVTGARSMDERNGAPAMPVEDPKAVAGSSGFKVGGQFGTLIINADGTYSYLANGAGTDHFQYSVTDGGVTRWVNLDITSNHVNHAPGADDDANSGDEDTTISGQVLGKDRDGDPLTFTLVSGPQHGSISFHSDGTYSYVPDADFHGSDSFTFKANDGALDSDPATVELTVNPVNDAPVIDEDIPVAQGGLDSGLPGVSWKVIGNYGPATGGGGLVSGGGIGLEALLAATGGYLTLEQINAGGTFVSAVLVDVTFTVPPGNQYFDFAYEVDPSSGSHDKLFSVLPLFGFSIDDTQSDASGPYLKDRNFTGPWPANSHAMFVLIDYSGDGGESSLVIKSVTLGSQQFLVGGATSPVEDTPFSGQFHAHDVDGDALTFSLVAGHGPSHGSVSIQSDGHFVYTPDANYHGFDSFQYQVSDGHGGIDTATYSFEVASVADAPVASGASAGGEEDSVISGQVHATDADNDSLTYSLVSGPQHGSLSFHSDGTYSYTPDANYHGPDSFTFKANDGTTDSNTATVSIDVDPPVNDAPVLGDVTFSGSGAMIAEDSSLNGALHATDADGDSLTFGLADGGAPAHGSVSIASDGSFTYTPDANYNGTDSFTYQVSDGNGGVDTDTLTINVTPVNDAPHASNGAFEGLENHAISGAVSASDVDGDTLVFGAGRPPRSPSGAQAINSGVQHGVLDFHSDGTFTYTPDHGFFGTDGFDFFVDDGHGGRNSAHVSLTVEAHNEAPAAADASASTDEDTALSGSVSATDADGDNLLFTLASGPSHGSISFHSDGSYTYTPSADYHGGDGFDYSVSDGNGGTDTGHVSIDVTSVNDEPRIDTPKKLVTDEDHAISGMANAKDADGDALSFELVDKAPAGLTFNKDGTWSFDPTKAYQTLDYGQASIITFSYRAYDGHAYSPAVTQFLTITGVNEVLSGGTAGKDTLTGAAIGDWIDGLGGDDTIKAMGGDDQVFGGGGADKLYGGEGRDYMHGDLGNDLVNGEAGDDQLFGDGGSDTMDGSDGDDTISGGDDNDVVKGGAGNDSVYGDAGNDDVQGGVGDDYVYGGAGADRLSGGTGADHFVFLEGDLGSTLATGDTVTDFKTVQGDVLDVSGIDANTSLDGDQAFSIVGGFGHHAGEMTMAYNAGINATVVAMDTNGDGVADYVLQLTGDVSSSAGWVL
ncbi:tandem-95 repeat protein [Caulobacter ginsengisoli]|nr:Ig-like domain-containing protein [Caulobacter ginsengisoli]